jgi:hypothetical protein
MVYTSPTATEQGVTVASMDDLQQAEVLVDVAVEKLHDAWDKRLGDGRQVAIGEAMVALANIRADIRQLLQRPL